MRRNAALDMRFEVIPDLDVAVFAQAAGNAAPHDPELDPDGLLLVKRHARRELSRSLFATPFIERVAEAWTQRVAGKLTPNALVVGRPAAFSCSRMQRAPHFTQHRNAPLLARTQGLLEASP